MTLVNNLAIHLYDELERAKIALSSAYFDAIQLKGEDIDLWQPITRAQFEALVATETRRIEDCMLDTLERSGLAPDEIDAVVRTGGSAQVPRYGEMLGRIFAPQVFELALILHRPLNEQLKRRHLACVHAR